MAYTYGPVHSRRLGVSLGVDLTPGRVCSLDCIYCEEARPTAVLTTSRGEYAPVQDVIKEINQAAATIGRRLDYITFSGSGEPTLHSRLGEIIMEVKKLSIPIAVLTNSTLLHRPDVRSDLMNADLVVPSLDALTQGAFARVNRPHQEIMVHTVVVGLKTFCQEYSTRLGKVWLEVLLVEGINDNEEEVAAIAAVANSIKIEKVHLNTVSRATTVKGVNPVSPEKLQRFKRLFHAPVEIYT